MKKLQLFMSLMALIIPLTGCWESIWPNRSMIVDLKIANSSYEEVAKVAENFLMSQNFKKLGKAGYDKINNTTTIIDFEGPNRLFVSIGSEGTMDLAHAEKVRIRFDQDNDSFSTDSNKIFEAMSTELESRWPGAITRTSIQAAHQ